MSTSRWSREPDLLVTGYGLWSRSDGVGGTEYLTDSCGCGHIVYNETFNDPLIVLEILERQGTLDKYVAKVKEKYNGSERKADSGD